MRRAVYTIKLIAALIATALIALALAVLPQRLSFRGGNSYTFYLGDTSKNCRVVTADGNTAMITRLTLSGVCGESATYSSFDWRSYLESVNGKVLFCEELEDSVNYYCEADLPYSVNLYGKKVNLHVCVKQDGITIGTPIIFGGY